jgi:hypothetical protein
MVPLVASSSHSLDTPHQIAPTIATAGTALAMAVWLSHGSDRRRHQNEAAHRRAPTETTATTAIPILLIHLIHSLAISHSPLAVVGS